MSKITAAVLGAALAGAAMGAGVSPAQAHHSFAMFDPAHPVQMEGIVQSWQFTNPHSWLQVAVLKNGQAVVYSIEAGSPSNLIRRGWSANSFHPGDKISLVFSPLRDGGDGGSFVSATKADGTTLAQERAAGPQPK